MPKRNLIWLLVVAGTAGLAVWITHASHRPETIGPNGAEGVARADQLIREHFYPGVGDPEYSRQVLADMIRHLDDPYSRYIPPEQAVRLTERVLGRQVGLGLAVEAHRGQIVLLGVDPRSPAHGAGLGAGDHIVALEGKPLAGEDVQAIRALDDGEVGRTWELTVTEAGTGRERTVSLQAASYPVEAVTGLYRGADGAWVRRLGPDDEFLYVRIREFLPDTPREFRAACHLADTRGLVLDLRDNPGGLLASAIAVADLFLREGEIVEVHFADDRIVRHEADAAGTLAAVPLVVLTDGGSASGAELVAAALQHHRRAMIVGARTRGKGLVQSLVPLGDGLGAFNLTTSEFFVGGRALTRRDGVEGWGVQPDEPVVPQESEREALRRLRRSAATLAGAVEPSAEGTLDLLRRNLQERILEADAPLRRALELLADPERMEALLEDDAGEDGGE